MVTIRQRKGVIIGIIWSFVAWVPFIPNIWVDLEVI